MSLVVCCFLEKAWSLLGLLLNLRFRLANNYNHLIRLALGLILVKEKQVVMIDLFKVILYCFATA